MPERTDFTALIAGHTTVIRMINAGDSGLPVLTQLLRVVQPAIGALDLLSLCIEDAAMPASSASPAP